MSFMLEDNFFYHTNRERFELKINKTFMFSTSDNTFSDIESDNKPHSFQNIPVAFLYEDDE